MENEKILNNVSYLDLLFKGKNKTYGAYELRKKYQKRILFSLFLSFLIFLFISILLFPKKKQKEKLAFDVKEIILNDVQLEEPEPAIIPPPPPPPSKKIEIPKRAVEKFTPPKVVPDKQVKKQEAPPKQEDLKNQVIGTKKEEGEKTKKLTGDSDSTNQGAGGQGNGDGPLTYVDISAKYPGNWHNFLERNLEYPEEAQEAGIEGKVRVSFVVDTEGNVSDIKIISGPIELREECVRVIKRSGKWRPAQKNGVKVKAYKIQDVVFKE